MPGIEFQQVRANVTVADVLELLGFAVQSRRGDQVRGACPLHASSEQGKHRSFSAHLGRHTFQCFKVDMATHRPLGIVSSMDILAAVARVDQSPKGAERRQGCQAPVGALP